MDKIAGYGAYQSEYQSGAVKNKPEQNKKSQTTQSGRTGEAAKAAQADAMSKLSDNAKKLLKELQATYRNMDFMVADYETEEEAQYYLSRGRKEFSVLIDPETLEEMAADSNTKEKYIGIIEQSETSLKKMANGLGDQKDQVTQVGITINQDGSVTYFANLQKLSEKQRERIEEKKEEQQKKDQEIKSQEEKEKLFGDEIRKNQPAYLTGGVKRTQVKAGSVEELLEKIKSVNWDEISEEMLDRNGNRFDYTI